MIKKEGTFWSRTGKQKYYLNREKILLEAKKLRLKFNQTLPPVNFKCFYCNKDFILPGVKKNGYKQRITKYCSTVCAHRQSRFNKLWIPKWLFNYYLDKKLWHFVVSFKKSKHSIFSPNRRALFGFKNPVTISNFFILWHPNSFLRKKYKWIDKLVNNYQTKKRLKWINKYQKSDAFHKYIKQWQAKQPKDSQYKISQALRKSVIGALKRQGVRKTNRTIKLLGTDKNTAIKHIESLWTEGMSWKNHGLGWDKWHIDHIKPCAEFNLKNINEQFECCYYKNLQPLWQKDNFDKGSKYEN